MKHISIVHLFQLVLAFVFLIIFKQTGYIFALSFATPSIYIFFILPLAIVAFVFVLIYVLLARKEQLNIYERIFALVISIIMSLMGAMGTWIYLTVATNFQIFIYVISFLLVISEILWTITKKESVRNTISKSFAKLKRNK